MTANNSTSKIAKLMMYLTWILGLALASYFFQNWIDKKHNPNQFLTSLDGSPVVLRQNSQGHYIASGKINNSTVTFLLDTGATHTVVGANLAKQLKLIAHGETQVATANGVITVYPTDLDTISIGSIKATNLKALINPFANDETVLLGMNFLKHLVLIQRDKTLTLSAP
jgi:aspartyl protease family protein